MPEQGWYHAEGDPPGTVRRWSGTEWIGFAVPDPLDPQAAARTEPKRSLDRRGSLLSVATLVSLTTIAVLFALLAARIRRGVDTLPAASIGPRSGAVVRVRDLDDFVANLWLLVGTCTLVVAVALVSFSFWSRAAAATAQTHRFSRASLRARRFEVSAAREVREPRPIKGAYSALLVVLFSATSGGTTSSHIAMNWFARVSDTAMAASTDPETGVASINPVKMIIWWVLWWVPLIAGGLMWSLVAIVGPVDAETMQTVLQATVVLLLLEIVALVCIVATVGQITSHLTN